MVEFEECLNNRTPLVQASMLTNPGKQKKAVGEEL